MSPTDRLARIAVQHVPRPGEPVLHEVLVATLLSAEPRSVIVCMRTEVLAVVDFYPREAPK